jgi:hypothetical protein
MGASDNEGLAPLDAPSTKETTMDVTCRVIALSLIVTFLAAGPLAPFARAQQPPTTATPESDLFQESLKASQDNARAGRPSAAYETGAVLVDAFYIPGKAILCTASFGVNIALLLLTFGTAYKAAAALAREGCGGKWYVTGNDLRAGESGPRESDWDDRGGI